MVKSMPDDSNAKKVGLWAALVAGVIITVGSWIGVGGKPDAPKPNEPDVAAKKQPADKNLPEKKTVEKKANLKASGNAAEPKNNTSATPKVEVPPAPPAPRVVVPAAAASIKLEGDKNYRFDAAQVGSGKTHLEFVEVGENGIQVGTVKFATVAGDTANIDVAGKSTLKLDADFNIKLTLEFKLNPNTPFVLDVSHMKTPLPKLNFPTKGDVTLILSAKQIAAIGKGSKALPEGVLVDLGDGVTAGKETSLTLQSPPDHKLEIPTGIGSKDLKTGIAAFQEKVTPPKKVEPKKVDSTPKTPLERANDKVAELQKKRSEKRTEREKLSKDAEPTFVSLRILELGAELDRLNALRPLANPLGIAQIDTALANTRASLAERQQRQRIIGPRTRESDAAADSLPRNAIEQVAINTELKRAIAAAAAAKRAEDAEKQGAAPTPKSKVELAPTGDGAPTRDAVVIGTKGTLIEAMAAVEQGRGSTRG